MDTSDFFLEKQGKTLEDLFFIKQDKILKDKLGRLEKMKETKKALSEVSGITDEDVLQKLVDLNVRPEIVASLALVPLIEIAWADGKIHEKEKVAVLKAASQSFVAKDNPDFSLLQQWLERKPDAKLFTAWNHYIKGLCKELTRHQKDSLKNDFIGYARQIAEATGGFLGIGKISNTEQEMLQNLETAFD